MTAYRSKNLAKHTHPSRIYRYLGHRFTRALLRLLAEAGPSTVLDAGCGEGFLLKTLAGQPPGYRLTGLDRSFGAVRYAVRQCPGAVGLIVADVGRLPFASGSFDAVVCSEVLEHVAAADPALAELARVARRHVVITVPREPWFRILARLVTWLRLGQDPEHVQFWTRRGFERLLHRRFGRARISTSSLYRLALCLVDGRQEPAG